MSTARKFLLPREVAETLRLDETTVDLLIERHILRAIELPSGERRIDARHFSRFLKVSTVGFTPKIRDAVSDECSDAAGRAVKMPCQEG
jgi:hypothetical protein